MASHNDDYEPFTTAIDYLRPFSRANAPRHPIPGNPDESIPASEWKG